VAKKKRGLAARLVPDLKAEADKIQASGGGGQFWRPDSDTTYYLRLLPFVHDKEAHIFREVWEHFGVGDRKGAVNCPAHDEVEPTDCPICTQIAELGLDDSRMEARGRYYCNIVVRDAEDRGVRMFPAPPGVAKSMLDALDDPELGDEVWDPEEGRDIQLKKTGSGLQTEYSVKLRIKVDPLDSSFYDDAVDLLEKEELGPLGEEELEEIAASMKEGGKSPKRRAKKDEPKEEESEEPEEEPEEEEGEEGGEEGGEEPPCFGDPKEYDPDDSICGECDFAEDCATTVKSKKKKAGTKKAGTKKGSKKKF